MLKLSVKIIIISFLCIDIQSLAKGIAFDTLNYKLYIDSVKYYASKQPEKALLLGKSLLNFIVSKKNTDELERLYEGLALTNYYLADRKEALLYLNLQRQLLHQKNDVKKLAEVYNRIGAIFHEWSLLGEALSYYNKAYQYAMKSNNQAILGQTFNNLGLINKDQGNYDKAYDYFTKAKEIYQQLNDQRNLSYTLNNIGIIYKRIKSYDKALDYFQQSLEIKKKAGETRTLANNYGNMAEVYLSMEKYAEAEKYFNEALVIHTEYNDKENILKDIIALAKISCLTNQLDKANNYLSNAEKLIKQETTHDTRNYFYEIKALYYEKKQQYKEALELIKKTKDFKDSIFNEQLLQKTVELEYLVNSGMKEHELNNLRIEHQAALEKLRKNLTSQYIFIISTILLFFILLFTYMRLRIGQKAKIAIEEKNLEIEKINEELITTNEELEDRVRQRTEQLLKEIAEKEKALKQVEEALKKAEESNYLKDAFLSNINHEIRTPLSSILGLSEVLKIKLSDNECTELNKYLDGIIQSSNRLLNLLNNILDLSRVQTNEIIPHINTCDPNKLVKKAGDLFIFRANEKKLELSFALGETPNILCDTDLLFKVLVEIIDNAIKYTSKGKIEISTSTKAPGNEVCISVSDTGIGIDESFLTKSFETFTQESIGYNRLYQGAGIGLALSHKLIKLMGGRIEIFSKKNVGTTVNIILPVSSEKAQESIIEAKQIETFINQQKGNILLVEDDDFNALFLNTVLEPIANVTWVKTGDEALETIEKQADRPFDVVILDINLPQQWEGISLLKTIQNKFPQYLHIPFIAQTAYSMPSDKDRIKASGFYEYFSKPIDTEYFINTIKLLLNKE